MGNIYIYIIAINQSKGSIPKILFGLIIISDIALVLTHNCNITSIATFMTKLCNNNGISNGWPILYRKVKKINIHIL